MMTLHCLNEVVKRPSVALNLFSAVCTAMTEEGVLVSGDFDGAIWKRKVGYEQMSGSVIELDGWPDVCGFLKLHGSRRNG